MLGLVATCTKCEKPVSAVHRFTYEVTSEDYEPDYQYLLYACPHCQKPFVAVRETGFEGYGQPVVIFPSDRSQLDGSVPANICASYWEAHACFQSGAYTAAAIMCRRTLEGICFGFEAKGRNLKDKLIDLKERGIIESRLYEWADHVLRALGNDAAHDITVTVSRQDADDALEFTKAIIQYLYMFEAAFKRFKERRENEEKRKEAEKEIPF